MSNAPEYEDDDETTELHLEDQERRQEAEAVIAYLSGAFRFFGVEKVVVAFNGSYGDLSIDVPVYHPALAGDLPFGLASRIGRLWEAFLPQDWDYEEGLTGTIAIDVVTGKVAIDITIAGDEEWVGEEWE